MHDEYGSTYTFPAFSVDAGQIARVHTGCGADTATDLFWCKDGTAVWNNGADCAYLKDSTGTSIDTYSC